MISRLRFLKMESGKWREKQASERTTGLLSGRIQWASGPWQKVKILVPLTLVCNEDDFAQLFIENFKCTVKLQE